MAVKIFFSKRRRITQAIGFGNFFAGHLQKMETVTFFHTLQNISV